MKITPNLMFKACAREAFQTYAEILNADRLDLTTFGEMPDASVGPEWRDKIAHAWLQVGDQAIMGSDSPPGVCADGQETATSGGDGSVALHFTTVKEARRAFDALADEGVVQMRFASTAWSPGFGMARDRFGKNWMINTQP